MTSAGEDANGFYGIVEVGATPNALVNARRYFLLTQALVPSNNSDFRPVVCSDGNVAFGADGSEWAGVGVRGDTHNISFFSGQAHPYENDNVAVGSTTQSGQASTNQFQAHVYAQRVYASGQSDYRVDGLAFATNASETIAAVSRRWWFGYNGGSNTIQARFAFVIVLDGSVMPTDAQTEWMEAHPLEMFKSSAPPADSTAPPTPGGLSLTAGAAGSGQATANWTAVADNTGGSGLAGYKLREGSNVYTVTTTTKLVTGLSAGTHSFTISAFDNAGNESAQSASVSVTIAAGGDTTAPAAPAAPVVTVTSGIAHVSEAAAPGESDAVGIIFDVRFASNNALADSHDVTLPTRASDFSTLMPGNYTASGRVYDNANPRNISPASPSTAFTVTDSTDTSGWTTTQYLADIRAREIAIQSQLMQTASVTDIINAKLGAANPNDVNEQVFTMLSVIKTTLLGVSPKLGQFLSAVLPYVGGVVASTTVDGQRTVTLSPSASELDGRYFDMKMVVLSGTGDGQQGYIPAYASKQCIVEWTSSAAVNLDTTSLVAIVDKALPVGVRQNDVHLPDLSYFADKDGTPGQAAYRAAQMQEAVPGQAEQFRYKQESLAQAPVTDAAQVAEAVVTHEKIAAVIVSTTGSEAFDPDTGVLTRELPDEEPIAWNIDSTRTNATRITE